MTDNVLKLVDILRAKGLEHFRVFYGCYRGIVRKINDPEKRGCIQVEIKPFNESNEVMNVWIDPQYPGAGPDRGTFWPAEVGDTCRVSFDNGHPCRPYLAYPGWYGEGQLPEEFAPSADGVPRRRGFVTRMGHRLVFSDEPGAESIRIQWFKASPTDEARTDASKSANRTDVNGETSVIHIEPDGSIQLINKAGTSINMQPDEGLVIIEEHGNWLKMTEGGITVTDNQGNWIEMRDGSINIKSAGKVNVNAQQLDVITGGVTLGKGAAHPNMKGDLWELWAKTHTHGTGVGPSGPPLQQTTKAVLSTKVKGS